MLFRVFLGLIVLGNALFLFDIYQLWRAHEQLESMPAGYSTGPENADLTVVEFLDYACQHCRDINPVIRAAVKEDGRVRYVPRPVPSNTEALPYTQLVYAAGEQGKFMAMHDALMTDFGPLDDARTARLVQAMALDVEKLKTDMHSEKTKKQVVENRMLITYFYAPSLPQFVIGGKIAYSPGQEGATVDDFLKIFKEARESQ